MKFTPRSHGAPLAVLVAAALLASTAMAAPATLLVHVESVSPRGGDLRVALYDERSYAGHDADPVTDKVVQAVAPETVVEFDDLPPGTYAIKTFQDINRNGTFDTNWIGLPLEPFGFSNDARPWFDQPSFADTKFVLGSDRLTVTIHLQHWLSDNLQISRQRLKSPRGRG